MVLEKTLESSVDSEEIKPVHPKGNQSWILFGRIDAEAEAPVLWPPDEQSWLIGKDSDAEKDWRREEKGTTDDKVVEWQFQLDGHEFEQAPGIGDGQGSLACCSLRGQKKSDTTKQLNWNECSTFTSSSFRIWNSSTRIPSPPVVLFVVMLPKAHWLQTPGCLALRKWSHHHGYLGH